MKASRFWMKSGILFIYGKSLDTEIHKHNAIQLVWPAGLSKCLVGNHCIDHAVVIAESQPHRLQMSQGWVLLIEPQSVVGEKLSKLLAQDKLKAIKDLNFFDARDLEGSKLNLDLLKPLLARLDLRVSEFDDLFVN